MIGYQLQTDIRGANAFGIDSVLITGGVSGPAAQTVLAAGPQPTYCLDSLRP